MFSLFIIFILFDNLSEQFNNFRMAFHYGQKEPVKIEIVALYELVFLHFFISNLNIIQINFERTDFSHSDQWCDHLSPFLITSLSSPSDQWFLHCFLLSLTRFSPPDQQHSDHRQTNSHPHTVRLSQCHCQRNNWRGHAETRKISIPPRDIQRSKVPERRAHFRIGNERN